MGTYTYIGTEAMSMGYGVEVQPHMGESGDF